MKGALRGSIHPFPSQGQLCMVLVSLGIASQSIEGQQLLQESEHSQMVLYVRIIMTTN